MRWCHSPPAQGAAADDLSNQTRIDQFLERQVYWCSAEHGKQQRALRLLSGLSNAHAITSFGAIGFSNKMA